MDFRHAWLSLKQSMKCKTHPSEIYVPEITQTKKDQEPRKLRSVTSSSFSHLREKNKKKKTKVGNSSPYSIASNEIPDPLPPKPKNMLLANLVFHKEKDGNVSKSKTAKKMDPKNGEEEEEEGATAIVLLQPRTCTELNMGDSTRNVVEIIFRTSWFRTEAHHQHQQQQQMVARIHHVLKINNKVERLERFQEYREMVKQNACKLERKHARCIADGNELLRFHGSSIACTAGSDNLPCMLLGCEACRAIETGFQTKETTKNGIVTTSSSGGAHRYTNRLFPGGRRAILVCRVIAGRIRKPCKDSRDEQQEFSVPFGFDSVAGDSKLEELYVSNPSGVLPCFLVIYSMATPS